MSEYTDRDVADMLGWEFNYSPTKNFNGKTGSYHFYTRKDKTPFFIYVSQCPFGLSTPPGPDADANAARYVLPWLKLRFPKSTLCILMDGDFWEITFDTEHSNLDSVIRNAIDEHFGPTLCRACLDAWRAKEAEDARG